MSLTLAMDTSLGTALAVVDADGTALVRHDVRSARKHAEVLGPMLQDAMRHRGSITRVVAGMGPGAFTGLRVGIAAAETVALGLGAEFAGVCSHDAIGCMTSGEVVVTTDVRRGERAYSRFVDGVRVEGPMLAPADAVPVPRGAVRMDAETIDAVRLACAANGVGLPQAAARVDGALYLRAADAVAPPGIKRVSQ